MTCSKMLVLAVCSSMAAGSANAALCAADQAAAATLLVPYFEVDLETCAAASGRTTRFWVRNVSEAPQLTQVTLWSDAGIAAAGFHIYLPPFASRHVDLADVLCRGQLPSTGAGVMPVSPFGAATGNANFSGCNGGSDPAGGVPVANQYSEQFLFEVQLRLTGQRTPPSGLCYGIDHDDAVARGYVTIDDVDACTTMLPSESAYSSILGFDNALVGGFQWIDATNNFAQGGAAVSIEAGEPGKFVPGDRTFYSRYNPFVSDRREPLPGSWSSPIRRGGVRADTTEVIVWRDTPRINPSTQLCNGFSGSTLPLRTREQRLFDDRGESEPAPIVFPGQIPPTPTTIGYATQRLDAFEIEDTSSVIFETIGSMAYVSLYAAPGGDPFAGTGQGWVGSIISSEGRFSDLTPGTAMDSNCFPGETTPADVSGPRTTNPNTRDYLFQDGFE